MSKLVCYKCGSDKLMNTPTMEKPLDYFGDKLIFTVCKECWTPNEFVNYKSSFVMIIPIKDVRNE